MFYSYQATGNCGMEYAFFQSYLGDDPLAIMAGINWDNESTNLPGIVIFSGNREQKADDCGPHAFAAWLREQGEKLYETPWSLNMNDSAPNFTIKAYMWRPSNPFRKKFNAKKKQIEALMASKRKW